MEIQLHNWTAIGVGSSHTGETLPCGPVKEETDTSCQGMMLLHLSL